MIGQLDRKRKTNTICSPWNIVVVEELNWFYESGVKAGIQSYLWEKSSSFWIRMCKIPENVAFMHNVILVFYYICIWRYRREQICENIYQSLLKQIRRNSYFFYHSESRYGIWVINMNIKKFSEYETWIRAHIFFKPKQPSGTLQYHSEITYLLRILSSLVVITTWRIHV